MKKIHDLLKARKKLLHATHDKKPLHADFHATLFERPLFSKRAPLSTVAAALSARASGTVISKNKPKTEPEPKIAKPAPVMPTPARTTTRFFSQKRPSGLIVSNAAAKKTSLNTTDTEDSDAAEGGGSEEEKERIARLRELLNDVINHPGMLTPQMFWILFIKIAPHFSMMTAGCVRISALFWLMLSYIKAKNKTKKRRLKEQLMEAAELLEGEEKVLTMKLKRR